MADVQKNVAPESQTIPNIVLLGRTGNGKSATGNSIARKEVFVSKPHSSGVTMECKKVRVETPEGPILNVIDTPGLFDISVKADFISREVLRCLTLAEGGIHAAILVLSAKTRFSKEEEEVLRTLRGLFGIKIVDYLIIVFSAGDELERERVTLEAYLKDCPDFLNQMLKSCGQRVTLFDNKTEDDAKKTQQVHELFRLIKLVREKNGNKPYTDEMYLKIQEANDKRKKEQAELEAKENSELRKKVQELEKAQEAKLEEMRKMLEKYVELARKAQEKQEEQMNKQTFYNYLMAAFGGFSFLAKRLFELFY